MECPVCGHLKLNKHGKTPNGVQRYFCPGCQRTFNERFDTLYYHTIIVTSAQNKFAIVLQAHSEGSSRRSISRTRRLADNTVVSIVRAASQRAQQVHNAQVQTVETQEVCALEMWSFVQTNYDGKVNWNVSSAEAGKAASVNREGFFG